MKDNVPFAASEFAHENMFLQFFNAFTKGRKKLPTKAKDKHKHTVWEFLRECVGRELSKITMPITFNEPLGLLQRLSEHIEYVDLLAKADAEQDPFERIKYVSAFAMSFACSNHLRLGKPFNPLLGETFEIHFPEIGFRYLTEQVSHHPPVAAFHCDTDKYTYCGDVQAKLSFFVSSQCVEIEGVGTHVLTLKNHNEVYTWNGVCSCVHNLVIGHMWIETYGKMRVKNLSENITCELEFKPKKWFGWKHKHKVQGFVYDSHSNRKHFLFGSWLHNLKSIPIDSYYEIRSGGGSLPAYSNRGHAEDTHSPYYQYQTSVHCRTLWQAYQRPVDSKDNFNFTKFAITLNERRQGVAPTDTRYRPDVCAMECGSLTLAREEKARLEEKQRDFRHHLDANKKEWKPVWFTKQLDPLIGSEYWMVRNWDQYWKREFSSCPDIF